MNITHRNIRRKDENLDLHKAILLIAGAVPVTLMMLYLIGGI